MVMVGDGGGDARARSCWLQRVGSCGVFGREAAISVMHAYVRRIPSTSNETSPSSTLPLLSLGDYCLHMLFKQASSLTRPACEIHSTAPRFRPIQLLPNSTVSTFRRDAFEPAIPSPSPSPQTTSSKASLSAPIIISSPLTIAFPCPPILSCTRAKIALPIFGAKSRTRFVPASWTKRLGFGSRCSGV